MLLPGRVPGYCRKLLPTNYSEVHMPGRVPGYCRNLATVASYFLPTTLRFTGRFCLVESLATVASYFLLVWPNWKTTEMQWLSAKCDRVTTITGNHEASHRLMLDVRVTYSTCLQTCLQNQFLGLRTCTVVRVHITNVRYVLTSYITTYVPAK